MNIVNGKWTKTQQLKKNTDWNKEIQRFFRIQAIRTARLKQQDFKKLTTISISIATLIKMRQKHYWG